MVRRISLALMVALVSTLLLATPESAEARYLNLSGRLNSQYTPVPLKRLVVAAPNVVDSFRHEIETRVRHAITYITDGGAEAIPFHDIVVRQPQTHEDVIRQLKAKEIEAVIIVDVQQTVSRRAGEPGSEAVPQDMNQALAFAANHQHIPVERAKYQPTFVNVYDLNTGTIIWQGDGQLNANATSVKWHKISGKILAKKLAKHLWKNGVLANKVAAPEVPQETNFNTD